MKIALVTTWGVECGIATYSEKLAKALEILGHQICIISEYKPKQSAPTIEGNLARVWRRGVAYEAVGGLGYATKVIKDLKLDIVHVQHEFGLFPSNKDFITFATENRAFTTLHTVQPPPAHFDLNNIACLEYVVHTPEAATCLDNVSIIPHGVELVESCAPDNYGLCPGFISESKGHLEIIEAFAWAAYKKHHRLIIAGRCRDFAYLNKLQAKINSLGLQEYVIIKEGFIPEPEMLDLIKKARYVILGAGKTSPYSASGQIHTAIGARVPVVAKDVPIYRSAAGSGTLYFRDPEEGARHILATFNDDIRGYLIDRHCSMARERDWGVVAKRHIDVWKKYV